MDVPCVIERHSYINQEMNMSLGSSLLERCHVTGAAGGRTADLLVQNAVVTACLLASSADAAATLTRVVYAIHCEQTSKTHRTGAETSAHAILYDTNDATLAYMAAASRSP